MSYEMDLSRYPTFFRGLMSCSESFRKSQENDPFEISSSFEDLPAAPSQRKFHKKSKLAYAPPNWIMSSAKGINLFESDSSNNDDESSSHEDKPKKDIKLQEKRFDELMDENKGSDADLSEPEDSFYLKMKSEMHRELERKSPKKKKKKKKIKRGNIVHIQPLFHKNAMLLLMEHPASASLYRYVSVNVLSGIVSVHGYELNSQDPPLRVFSSDTFGLTEVKTERPDALWKNKEGVINLSRKLKKVTGTSEIMEKIMLKLVKDLSNSIVVVLLENCIVQPRLLFVELYYPVVFKFSMTNYFKRKFRKIRHLKSTYCLPQSDSTIKFNTEVEELAIDILAALRRARLRRADGPRILIYGPQKTGKSAMLRYLMNKTLSLVSSLVYMDTDPGHPEFTPPGVVSLFDVTKPVTGPTFAHQRTPIAMSFTGATSADLSPDVYNKSVERITNIFQNTLSDETLFVNTMGTDKSMGVEYLKSVMLAVRPTILIEIATEENDPIFDYQEYSTKKTRYYQIERSVRRRPRTDKRAAVECSMSLLSYFGKCEMHHENSKYLNSFKTVCISWCKIPIYSFGKRVQPDQVIESINASFVALCRVHKSLILKSTISTNPKTLKEDPENDCIGFGIVRAIDETKKVLHIITPLSLTELKSVNAIMKGNIMVPPPVFLEQPILDVPLPFANASIIIPPKKEAEDRDAKIFIESAVKMCGKKKQH